MNALLCRVWCSLMLSQSLLVFCSDSHLLSDVMISLQSLITPLTPLHDFRPYFTVYDNDYYVISSAIMKRALPSPLLAGTNDPFIAETLGSVIDVVVIPSGAQGAKPIPGLVVDFAGAGALKRLIATPENTSYFVEHEALKAEGFIDRFTTDINAILFRGNRMVPCGV